MHVIKFDVTCDEDRNSVLKHIEKHCDETGEFFYALVNNAGVSSTGAIEWGDEEEVKKILQVNLYGSIQTTRHFIPLLVKCPGSRVIAMTSYLTTAGVPLMSSYGISKVSPNFFSFFMFCCCCCYCCCNCSYFFSSSFFFFFFILNFFFPIFVTGCFKGIFSKS